MKDLVTVTRALPNLVYTLREKKFLVNQIF